VTLTDAAILALEHRRYRQPGAKEQAIATELAMTPTRYYQRLARLLEDRRALALDPLTVNRLRRVRAARSAVRGHG
jgi:hypothetical protein